MHNGGNATYQRPRSMVVGTGNELRFPQINLNSRISQHLISLRRMGPGFRGPQCCGSEAPHTGSAHWTCSRPSHDALALQLQPQPATWQLATANITPIRHCVRQHVVCLPYRRISVQTWPPARPPYKVFTRGCAYRLILRRYHTVHGAMASLCGLCCCTRAAGSSAPIILRRVCMFVAIYAAPTMGLYRLESWQISSADRGLTGRILMRSVPERLKWRRPRARPVGRMFQHADGLACEHATAASAVTGRLLMLT